MAEKSILSQLHPRSSLDNSSVEITIIEPHIQGLHSISTSSHSKHHHHRHNQKKTGKKKWEVQEDLQKKMKEVRQKIRVLEAQESLGSGCHSIPKGQQDILKRNIITGKTCGSIKMLTKCVSEGELHRRKNTLDCQKLKSGFCQACNLQLLQQQELLKFVSAQHQQVLHIMSEIKAELQLLKSDKILDVFKKKSKSITLFQSIGDSLSTKERRIWQQQKDNGIMECVKQKLGMNQKEEDFSACTAQSKETAEAENSATTSVFLIPTAKQQHKQLLPTTKAKQIQKDPEKKENVVGFDRIKDSTQKSETNQKIIPKQYNINSGAISTYSTKLTKAHTKTLSNHTSIKHCNTPATINAKDAGTLPQRKLYSKSYSPEMTNKFQKEKLVSLNTKHDYKSGITQQKMEGCASKSYGYKNDKAKDNQNRQLKPLNLLKTCHLRQRDNIFDKSDANEISNLTVSKDNSTIIDSNPVIRNIHTISSSPKEEISENESYCSPARIINYPSTSQINEKSSVVNNCMTETNTNLLGKYQCSSRSSLMATQTENTEITSKHQSMKHKLNKLLRTKKDIFSGDPEMTVELNKPPVLNRDSPSSLTFVIEKSEDDETNESDRNASWISEDQMENYKSGQYVTMENNAAVPKKSLKDVICTSHYVHNTSYTAPSFSFEGKCNTHEIPNTGVTHGAGRTLNKLVTKRSIFHDRTKCNEATSSEDNRCSIHNMPSLKVFCSEGQPKDDFKFGETQLRNEMLKAKLAHHSLVFWDGESFVVDEEARHRIDTLMSTCLVQNKKEGFRKMFDHQDNINVKFTNSEGREDGRASAAVKGPVEERQVPKSSQVIQKERCASARNSVQQSCFNPHFTSNSGACFTPRIVEKPVSNPITKVEQMGDKGDVQEIELSLSFDDLEYLLLHKIKKQEMKQDLVQLGALRKTLRAVRQCFITQQKLLHGCSVGLESPKHALSRIKTVILSPRK